MRGSSKRYSVCELLVIAAMPYPKGSPTTKKATSSLSALARIASLSVSTMSRSATTIVLP